MSREPFATALQWQLLQAMQQARAAYGRGEWARAEQLARVVLNARASDVDALNLVGIIAAQTQRTEQAAILLGRAVAANPGNAATHNNYGSVLRCLQRLDAALASYDRAVQIKPDYADAHNNRGNTLQELGRFEEALASYDRALQIKPDYADAHYNRGHTLQGLRRFEEALASYARALEINPDHAEAHNNRGNLLQELRRCAAALASCDRALQIKPDYADAHNNRGNALKGLARFEEALASYDRALQLQPDSAVAHYNRGNTLQELRRCDAALASYDRALQIKPDDADVHNNRGNTLQGLGRFDEALASYDRALQIRPDYVEAHNNRGNVLRDLRRFADACDSYQRALQLRPDFEWLRGMWLHTRMQLCDWSDLAAQVSRLAAGIGQGHRLARPFVVLTMTDSLALQRQAAQIWANAEYPPGVPPALAKRTRRKRIRLGYYSSDYHDHAIASLTAELFELHDRDRFEVVAFSLGPDRHDAMRARLAAGFDRFLDVRTRSDSEIARASRELEIDIAVDLNGFTQHARPGIFACRAAPLQVTYLGYPGTLGLQCIDYLVADRTLIPEQSRPHYAERIVYLPHSYQANDRKRPIADRVFCRAELGLPSTGFVYCCFNNSYKITPETFDGWMRILGQVKDSVLWLLADNETAASNLRHAAQARNVDPARLVFAARLPVPEHLARQRAADLFLDTLPYNAHTTASDALWAGLPLLTLSGQSFAARVAASLLRASGLPELITTTQHDYERLAIELAGDPGRLAQIAERLRRSRSSMPLFDTAAFTRHLEDAYLQMYARYLADLSPEDIPVAG